MSFKTSNFVGSINGFKFMNMLHIICFQLNKFKVTKIKMIEIKDDNRLSR